MDYGEKLFELRKQLNLSQEEVAIELGVSRQSISLWETNQASPSMDNLILIAKLFKVSLDELVGIKTSTYQNNLKDEPIYQIKYREDKKVIYRRDYRYINTKKELIKVQLTMLFYVFAIIAFINALSVELPIARILLIMGNVSIMIGLMIYPLSVWVDIRRQVKLKQSFEIGFTKNYVELKKSDDQSEQISYAMIDYYIDKHEYFIVYLKDKRRIYLPVQNKEALKHFIFEHIHRRKRRKPLWK